MDIEEGFRRFQDFGLFAGLTIAITVLGLVLAAALDGTSYERTVRIGAVVCVMFCLLGTITAA